VIFHCFFDCIADFDFSLSLFIKEYVADVCILNNFSPQENPDGFCSALYTVSLRPQEIINFAAYGKWIRGTSSIGSDVPFSIKMLNQ
jgi:hypothetical protein